ncbi:hypothetical protein LAZ67_21001563 [Cordylochernes scorpioides]|uniref:Mos1 transposase HTH domain-containing protein n=1 Tax=Cordylochernes scorpioides TaxID=51811 RepID=A0ABY6LNW8_9ARAC|nr:hypothetical protein LAZ67_21001563 [Cordylochernes scorpioides]
MEDQRICIKFCVKNGFKGAEIFWMLPTAYGDAILSRRRVFECVPGDRPHQPPEKVDKVLELVREDRRITVREVAEEAGISFGSTQSIMKDILGVRRLNAVLVPKDLTFDQKNARKETASLNLEATTDDPELLKRVITGEETWIYGLDSETTQQASEWRFKNEPRPKKARKAPSKVKVMLTVFFDYQGIVHHEFQQQGSKITADSYLGVLRRLREAIRQKRPELWRSKFLSATVSSFFVDISKLSTLPRPRLPVLYNMLTKYQMIKFIDFCEVWFLPESVARVAPIVGDHRCHTPRHLFKEALDVFLGYNRPSRFHTLPNLIWNLRIILLHEFKLGRSAAQATKNIIEAWGEASSSERTIRRWFQKFKVGDFGLEDQDDRGRRSTFKNEDLKSHIESNNTQTVRESYMGRSEALHWTRQQQHKIDMDPEYQLYTPKIVDIATAVIEMYEDI